MLSSYRLHPKPGSTRLSKDDLRRVVFGGLGTPNEKCRNGDATSHVLQRSICTYVLSTNLHQPPLKVTRTRVYRYTTPSWPATVPPAARRPCPLRWLLELPWYATPCLATSKAPDAGGSIALGSIHPHPLAFPCGRSGGKPPMTIVCRWERPEQSNIEGKCNQQGLGCHGNDIVQYWH